MDYTLYRTATGEIVQSGWGTPPALPGTAVVAGQHDGATRYIDADGNPRALPAKPGPWARWSRAGWIDPRTPDDLAAERALARQQAVAAINAAAGAIRRLHVTDIPGQAALYLMKEAEARGWVAAADPDPSGFPLIAAEIRITAPTGDEVAQVHLNLAALDRQAAARLERLRLGHIARAETAADVAAAEAAARMFVAAVVSRTDPSIGDLAAAAGIDARTLDALSALTEAENPVAGDRGATAA